MRLLTKYNRINMVLSIIIFLIGSVLFYFMLHYVLIRQLDKSLRGEQQEIEEYIQQHKQLPEIENTKEQWTSIKPTTVNIATAIKQSGESYNEEKGRIVPVRQRIFTIVVNGKGYMAIISKSQIETDDLLKLIIVLVVGMIALILLSNNILNRKIVHKMWLPFYKTVDDIKSYRVSSQQPLQLGKENIDEFSALNESVNEMTTRIDQDYVILKTFTENAAHEMQTPVAVIRSKVDMLLQNPEWNEKSAEYLQKIEEAVHKISRLNQSLLLLAKLENRQFIFDETTYLNQVINKKIEERVELIHAKQIHLHSKNIVEKVVLFHSHLIEILIGNLLNNAIRYTPVGGDIVVRLTEQYLSV